jgi:peptidoglycan/LPS O-acetylase OafA/YrhL
VSTDRLVPPPNSLIRPVMPELDVLRGIAILLVVAYHALAMNYEGTLHFSGAAQTFVHLTGLGWLGVNLFFVLSGFLITGVLLESKEKPNYYRRFYLRRALRIVPIYYSLLLIQLIFGWSTAAYFGLNLVFLSNVMRFFGVAPTAGMLWSLAVEEHYYLLWPVVTRRLNRRHLALAALAICIVVPLFRGIWFGLGHDVVGLRTITWFAVDNLAAGSLLALVARSLGRPRIWLLCIGLLIAAVAMAVWVGRPYGLLHHDFVQTESEALFQLTVAGMFFGGVLLLFLLLGTSSWRWLVQWPMLSFLGYISYGLYLFHTTVFSLYDAFVRRLWPSLQPRDYRFDLVFLRFVVAGGLAVAFSYLSRRYFEERFLRLKKPLEAKYLG